MTEANQERRGARRVDATLSLQVSLPDGQGPARVPCEGLVVRTVPEVETVGCEAYEVAVFFTHITAEAKATLERHLALLLDAGT